jgi:hypothetical protein
MKNVRMPYCGVAILLFLSLSTAGAQIGGLPGAFSRIGFGARGMGMGNAMIAVADGDVVGYYNPALLPWISQRHAAASMGILGLDRKLNFLEFSQALPPDAGLSFGIINAGVSNIDGRDNDGRPTGMLQTSENQFHLGFAVRVKEGFSIGINVKMYYYHLYTDLSSFTAGVDFGALYPVNESLTLGATVRDIGSKYKWDSSTLLGQQGQSSEDTFPLLYTIGAAYRLPDTLAVLSAEIEASSVKTLIVRAGVEVPLIPEFTVRAGIDRVDLKEKGNGVRPAFGFTARKPLEGWTPSIVYVYVVEPFTTSGMHMISLSVRF